MKSEPRLDQTFAGRVLITIGFVVLVLLLVALVYFVFDVVLLIFAATLLAIFLRGLAGMLGRYIKLRPAWLVLIVSVLLIAILAGAITFLAPDVADQVRHLREELPKSAQAAANYISQFRWGRAVIDQLPSVDDIRARVDPAVILSNVGGIFSTTVGAIGNCFVVVLLAIYLATEPKFYVNGFTKLFPIRRRDRVREILDAVGEALERWLIGKAASMLFIGMLTWIGLSILGVPLALTLGLLAGLLSFIPNFGPIISALPALLLAFIPPGSPITAVYVLGLYIGVQLVESNIVTPLIERRTVELPPALTVTFQLALAVLVGGLGLILATPLLAMIMVVVQMVYVQDILGDRDVEVEEKELED
jgi:predicted PurR-regulated permease PerM